MATYAQIARQRRDAVRDVRRLQRELDTRVERMERRLFRLMDRKTMIDLEDAVELVDKYWAPIEQAMRDCERQLNAFLTIFQA